MNPEDNKDNQVGGAAPAATPEAVANALTPEAPAAEAPAASSAEPAAETPSLDQVAADLTAAAPEVAAEAATTPEAPATPATETPATETPVTPIEPAVPVAAETPTTLDAPVSPVASPNPETPGESPAPFAPGNPLTSESTVETPATPSLTDPVEETTPPASADFTSTETESTTSASFIDDAPAAPKPAAENTDGEEEPLKPADPVPGSIGSALAYSDTAPDHAVPIGKPKKKILSPLSAGAENGKKKIDLKGNMKLIIIIIAAVVLVAVVVIVLLFVMNGNNSTKKTATTTPAQTVKNTPVVSSLTCTLQSDDGAAFSNYGSVMNGTKSVVAMYSNDVLGSLGTTMTLNYGSAESANDGMGLARQEYANKYAAANLNVDPFTSTYDVAGTTLTVTHQADGEKIDNLNAKVMDLFVLRGEVITDIDTLQDSYEEDGFTCVTK